MTGPVRLAEIRSRPLSLAEVVDAVDDRRAGGAVTFVGRVRDQDAGRGVIRLEYTAHPSAVEKLRGVAEGVARAHPVFALAAVHRVGLLELGDLAVVVAVACAHRGEAFRAARMLIDEIKLQVPIWKHQQFADGGEQWVGSS